FVADNLSAAQLDHAVAVLADQFVCVRCHQDGSAVLINAVEHVHDFNAVLAVQVARGLIGKQDRWPVDNSAGNADALLLTTGKFSWLASSLIFKTYHFQCVRHPFANLSPGGTNNFHGESHIVENRTFAQQPEVLENE